MASRRSSAPRDDRSRSRRSARPGRSARAAAGSGSNTTPIIVGGGVLLLVVLITAMTMTGGDKDTSRQPEDRASTSSPEVKAVASPVPNTTPMPTAKAGKEPTKTAPALTAEILTKADAYYAKAKKEHDDGRRAQSAGDNKEFNKLINDSWDTLEQLDEHLELYTNWLEEADMESWRLPGPYVKLQRRLGPYDKLRARLHRVKSDRQK